MRLRPKTFEQGIKGSFEIQSKISRLDLYSRLRYRLVITQSGALVETVIFHPIDQIHSSFPRILEGDLLKTENLTCGKSDKKNKKFNL